MRHARLKPAGRDTWHHCFNRAVGNRDDRPFADADKEQLVRILTRVAALYTVRIVAYQVMSNHFHLLLQAPAEPPSEEETARRFTAFHGGRRKLCPGTKSCRQWQARLRDVSWCMRHFQHLYSAWYNRSRPVRRRGPLWAGRFKNTVLEDGAALWACWSYIECNPVRAGMVADAADYRFCSYGAWMQTGRHPFDAALCDHLIPALPAPLQTMDPATIRQELGRRLAAADAGDAVQGGEGGTEAAAGSGAEAEPPASAFTLTARRRVRHWVDGLVIGSELFVRETIRRCRPEVPADRHRLSRTAAPPARDAPVICCWRRLRVMAD
jgi:REP element-mobilizing transposase RayT